MSLSGRVAAVFLFAAVAGALAWSGPVAAGPAGPGLGIGASSARDGYAVGEPIDLTVRVTNDTGAACGLSRADSGTVRITQVTRDGRALTPVLARSFWADGVAGAAPLTRVGAGAAVDVPVRSVRIHDGDAAGDVVLRSTVATEDGGGLDTLWPVGTRGRYAVTVGYALPDLAAGTACAAASGTATVEFTIGGARGGVPGWVWFAAGGLLLVVIAGLVVWLASRRRRVGAAALLVVAALLAVPALPSRPAFADYGIDPTAGIPIPGVDFTSSVNACMARYAAKGGDPANLLPRLKNAGTPKVRIIPTTGGSGAFETPTSPDGPGSSTVTWNPAGTETYEDGIKGDPCAALYHELSHSDDISRDAVPAGECDDTGILTAEVKATMTENRYRVSQGLDPRKQYAGHDLPKSLNDCKKPKKKTAPAKGPTTMCENSSQCGSTNGDPHLATFDHVYYDFQAVGEFETVRATAGDPLEIQTRQAPLAGSRTVSVNTAVAFRVGAHRVMLALVDGVTQVRLDGTRTDLAEGDRALPGGGTLTRRPSDLGRPDGYDLTWPDGSVAAIDQIGVYGYRLLVKLAPDRAGHVTGLLGNFNGDPTDDLSTPAGKRYATPMSFDQTYPGYADAWRLTPAQSLFTYAAGQSTATYTDRTFPDRPAAPTDAQLAQATALCTASGVAGTWAVSECAFDVAMTGRPEFAVAAASTEAVAPPVATPIAAPTIATGAISGDGSGTLAFTGTKGEAVFVDLTAPGLPDRCSPYELAGPDGTTLDTGCNIHGAGFIDRTVLPVDGRYTVRVAASAGLSGHVEARVYRAHDTAGTLAPNGSAVSMDLAQPGSLATYTFHGTAGERALVEVADTSLPDA